MPIFEPSGVIIIDNPAGIAPRATKDWRIPKIILFVFL
jgi:hypothetical protein